MGSAKGLTSFGVFLLERVLSNCEWRLKRGDRTFPILKAGAIALVSLIGLRKRSLLLWHRQTDLKALHHRALAVMLEVGEILWFHLTEIVVARSYLQLADKP